MSIYKKDEFDIDPKAKIETVEFTIEKSLFYTYIFLKNEKTRGQYIDIALTYSRL
ncbi:hypothetical protein ACA758_04540 [Mycoplasmopsis agassizii]|uniref:hypothetical protein n=1 Tax=Mycoplasmopsis agassizii TaxID=33922 RepID=UPI003527FD30